MTAVTRLIVFAVVGAVTVLAPGSALAVKAVPPGNSAVNQYTETLPGPSGNTPSSEAKSRSPTAKALGTSNAARLEALGPEGRAAAQLAAGSAPQAAGNDGSHVSRRAPGPRDSSGLGQVLRQLTGTSNSSGMGLLLPLVIVLALVGSMAFFVARRRSTSGDPG